MIILDASGLLAAVDDSQRSHAAAVRALKASRAPRLLSPFVLAELDYMVSTRVSPEAARRLLQEVADGAYQLESFEAADLARAVEILETYADLNIGLADASLVVLAERHGGTDVLTLDERHFRALRTKSGRSFRVLPADLERRISDAAPDEPNDELPVPPSWERLADGSPAPNVVRAIRRSRETG